MSRASRERWFSRKSLHGRELAKPLTFIFLQEGIGYQRRGPGQEPLARSGGFELFAADDLPRREAIEIPTVPALSTSRPMDRFARPVEHHAFWLRQYAREDALTPRARRWWARRGVLRRDARSIAPIYEFQVFCYVPREAGDALDERVIDLLNRRALPTYAIWKREPEEKT